MAERKKPEPIRIIFNGQEEYSTEVDALYKVTGKLMVKFAPKFEYMSLEAIKEMLVVVMDMIQEASVLFKKGGVHTSRHLKSLATQIKHCKTKDELIIYIYNQFLLAEGLNTPIRILRWRRMRGRENRKKTFILTREKPFIRRRAWRTWFKQDFFKKAIERYGAFTL